MKKLLGNIFMLIGLAGIGLVGLAAVTSKSTGIPSRQFLNQSDANLIIPTDPRPTATPTEYGDGPTATDTLTATQTLSRALIDIESFTKTPTPTYSICSPAPTLTKTPRVSPTLIDTPTNTDTPTPLWCNTPTATNTAVRYTPRPATLRPITRVPVATGIPVVVPTLAPTVASGGSTGGSTGSSHPAGATALCKDGTYSYSKTHSGTCSHHKGVAVWYQ